MTAARRLVLATLGLVVGWLAAPLPRPAPPDGATAPAPRAAPAPPPALAPPPAPCPAAPPPPERVEQLRQAVAQAERTIADAIGVPQPFPDDVRAPWRPDEVRAAVAASGADVLALDCDEYPCLLAIRESVIEAAGDHALDLPGLEPTGRVWMHELSIATLADPDVDTEARRTDHRVRMLLREFR